uniref:TLC domain-containing protein n=1 Tax=Megaviridae environmental sample TaxID=1737588 RepID=A0A5J6VIX7_9VIRU|nr:MAG: hypothetical protein [Megaviridae environmental sample]
MSGVFKYYIQIMIIAITYAVIVDTRAKKKEQPRDIINRHRAQYTSIVTLVTIAYILRYRTYFNLFQENPFNERRGIDDILCVVMCGYLCGDLYVSRKFEKQLNRNMTPIYIHHILGIVSQLITLKQGNSLGTSLVYVAEMLTSVRLFQPIVSKNTFIYMRLACYGMRAIVFWFYLIACTLFKTKVCIKYSNFTRRVWIVFIGCLIYLDKNWFLSTKRLLNKS